MKPFGRGVAQVLAAHAALARLLAVGRDARRVELRLDEAVHVVDRHQHGVQVLHQVLDQAAVRLAGDQRLEDRGHGFRRLPLARVDAAVHEHGALGETLGRARVRVADHVGPDFAARKRFADDLAVHLVVQCEQRLVLREERRVLAKARDRRHRGDRYGRRKAECDVIARVVGVGVGEQHVTAAGGERDS